MRAHRQDNEKSAQHPRSPPSMCQRAVGLLTRVLALMRCGPRQFASNPLTVGFGAVGRAVPPPTLFRRNHAISVRSDWPVRSPSADRSDPPPSIRSPQMAHKFETAKYWICGCNPTTGDHIIDGHYSACVYCGKNRYDLKEIVVPSGLGGVFTVQILDVLDGKARVKVVNNHSGFNNMPPFTVEFAKIAPRWKPRVGGR